MNIQTQHVTVLIIGGGPSGLTAAAALAPYVDGTVLVLDRERETGGIPRHSDHPGYGIRDRRSFVSGPRYARRLSADARAAGAVLKTETMVTASVGARSFETTSPRGRRIITADAVILATGARERARPARRIPGDRPDGVLTTGQLQNLVHVHGEHVGERAVVIGAEPVSWSAVMTLREAGCSVAAMISRYPRSESYTAFRVGGRLAFQAPVIPHSKVVRIDGNRRVESVEIEDLRTHVRRTIPCDTIVTTGDWIPDNELVRMAGLTLDPATLGPVVSADLATSQPGVFSVGNLVHPVDTADAAALDGQHVAPAVLAWLDRVRRGPDQLNEPDPFSRGRLQIVAAPPFRWVTPQLVAPEDTTPRGHLLTWTDEYRRSPAVIAVQDGHEVGRVRTWWPAAPGRIYRIPSKVIAGASPSGGPVSLHLA